MDENTKEEVKKSTVEHFSPALFLNAGFADEKYASRGENKALVVLETECIQTHREAGCLCICKAS